MRDISTGKPDSDSRHHPAGAPVSSSPEDPSQTGLSPANATEVPPRGSEGRYQKLPETLSAQQTAGERSAREFSLLRFLTHSVWAMVVLLLCILGAIIFFARAARETAGDAASSLAGAFRANVTVENVFHSTLGKVDPSGKLVVCTQEVDVEIAREEQKRIFKDLLPAGTARVRIRALGNKVQYYIPLKNLTKKHFSYDPLTRVMRVKVPAITVDRDLVEVQTDPTRVIIEEKGSWSPIGPSVKKLTTEAMGELRNEVLRVAYHDLIMNEARRQAQMKLDELFLEMKDALNEGVQLQILLP